MEEDDREKKLTCLTFSGLEKNRLSEKAERPVTNVRNLWKGSKASDRRKEFV